MITIYIYKRKTYEPISLSTCSVINFNAIHDSPAGELLSCFGKKDIVVISPEQINIRVVPYS